jgi:hypothetical protein
MRTYTYSFSILCIEFHVARPHNKFCGSFPHHIKVEEASTRPINVDTIASITNTKLGTFESDCFSPHGPVQLTRCINTIRTQD